jgi:hypothetical protein
MPPKKKQEINKPALALLYTYSVKRVRIATLLSACVLLFACKKNQHPVNAKKKVEIRNENGVYKLYKNGNPFIIKGAVGHTHMEDIAASGGNTVLIWDTALIEKTLINAAQNNLSVIVGLDIPSGELTAWYKDEIKVNKMFADYEAIVNKYRNHPALLAWGLGNELIMPISSTSSQFYKTYNRFLSMIHKQDQDHPVTTTIINYQKQSILNIRWKIRGLDFISINTYNKIKDIRWELRRLKLIWDGPFMLSEWSPNGGWEAETTVWGAPLENTSTKKAEQYYHYYKTYMPHNDGRFIGSLAFYWGNRQEYTHTWYSVYNEDGIPTEVKEALSDCWQGKETAHKAVKLQYMLIDSMGARDNILLSPGSQHTARLLLADKQSTDSLRYSWEIIKEDWFNWGRTWHYFKRPVALQGLLTDSTTQNTMFICPKKEGPYRIFINVYDKNGYCATANTPFYVVNNEL